MAAPPPLPEALIRPKERTLAGVCEYIAEAEKDLKKAASAKKPDADEIERLEHRLKVLELKKAKYERIQQEKRTDGQSQPYAFDPSPDPAGNAAQPATAPAAAAAAAGGDQAAAPGGDKGAAGGPRAPFLRKDSHFETLDRINKEFDDQASDMVLTDAIRLLGDSVDLSRFLAYFADEGDSSLDTAEQSNLLHKVTLELEKVFGSGDELLAKQLLLTASRSPSLDDFVASMERDVPDFDIPIDLLDTLYDLIHRGGELSDVSIGSFASKMDLLSVVLENNITSISSAASEGRAKVLEVLLTTMSAWGEFLEVLEVMLKRCRLFRIVTTDVVRQRRRLGKHIAHVFSTVTFATAAQVESSAWNAEQAQSNMDDAVKALWRVSTTLISSSKDLLNILREREANRRASVLPEHGTPPDSSSLLSQAAAVTASPAITRASKLEKFFGAAPLTSRPHKYAYVIEEAKFDRNVFFTMEGNIKGGTMEKLVDRLTHHVHYDEQVTFAFLVTFPSMIEPLPLLRLLVERYKIAPPAALDEHEREYFIKNKSEVVKKRVADVLLQWVRFFPELFRKNEALKRELCKFVDNTLVIDYAQVCAKIYEILEGDVDPYAAPLPDEKPPKPLQPPKKGDKVSILTLDPLEVARQLCLIDYNMFAAIRPEEFIKLAWSKKEESHKAPHIMAIIQRSTQLTSFVCHTILEHKELKGRVDALRQWILILEKCRQLKNYNTLMAIMGGLVSSAIHRLTLTWRYVTKKEEQVFEEVRQLMSYQRNFGMYREAIKVATPPCLPFLGIYLTDLTFIEDGNKDQLANAQFINFDKRFKAAGVIKNIQACQHVRYNFEPVKEIEAFLSNIAEFQRNEEEFYQISLNVEKKDSERELLARHLAEIGLI